MQKKIWIGVGLVVWMLGAIAGINEGGNENLSSRSVVYENKEKEENGGTIERGGWMAFGLAVQEMSYEGAIGNCRESGNGGFGLRTKDWARRTRIWNVRVLRCEEVGRFVSAKRLTRYYVFGLCKMLD